MVRDVIWFLICFFTGILVGGFGKYLLAANDAIFVGLILGFVIGAILIGVIRIVEYFD